MQANRAEITLSEDGILTLHGIPFRRGESVEVIVLPFVTPTASGSRYPLRGTPVNRVQPKGGSDIVTGGAFRRAREEGGNLVEANALRQKFFAQITSPDPKVMKQGLVNAQINGRKSPVISTTSVFSCVAKVKR